MMEQRPRFSQSSSTETAASKLPSMLRGIAEEEWETGAQVTPTIMSDRFCLSKEEGQKGLTLLVENGILEELNGSFFVKQSTPTG